MQLFQKVNTFFILHINLLDTTHMLVSVMVRGFYNVIIIYVQLLPCIFCKGVDRNKTLNLITSYTCGHRLPKYIFVVIDTKHI